MEKEFVPCELAVKLKALGFDEPCFGYYVDGELRGINLGIEELGGIEPYYQRFGFHTLNNHDIDNPNKIVVTAPTFSQAFRWFTEEHDLYYSILPRSTSGHRLSPTFNIAIYRYYMNMNVQAEILRVDGKIAEYADKEEAELACLDKLIEIVKPKSL